MTKLLSQRDYWNSRALDKGEYGPPLVLSREEIDFQRKYVVPGGRTLVLGATPALCAMALEVSSEVTSVDYADDIVQALRLEGVRYECMDWNRFFEQNTEQFDNIMTDGGLVCLEFPGTWQQMVQHIYSHLKPGGVFAAKVYISSPEPPKQSDNPSIQRFMTLTPREEDNWMVAPTHSAYDQYDVRYALPPEPVVLQTFDHLDLVDKFIPEYEAGERFVSYAWQRPL